MSKRSSQVQPITPHSISGFFPVFIFIGITLVVLGFTLLSLSAFSNVDTAVKVGGFIWIIPLPPIMLGTGSPIIVLPIFFIIIIIFIAILIWSVSKASRI